MKPVLAIVALVVFCLLLVSCGDDAAAPGAKKAPLTEKEIVLQELDSLHNVGMGKMGRLTTLQQQARRTIDSIALLPKQAQQKLGALKIQLDTLYSELKYAEFAMDKWMNEFYVTDTPITDTLTYYKEEKTKASKITDAILSGIRKADSLFSK